MEMYTLFVGPAGIGDHGGWNQRKSPLGVQVPALLPSATWAELLSHLCAPSPSLGTTAVPTHGLLCSYNGAIKGH